MARHEGREPQDVQEVAALERLRHEVERLRVVPPIEMPPQLLGVTDWLSFGDDGADPDLVPLFV